MGLGLGFPVVKIKIAQKKIREIMNRLLFLLSLENGFIAGTKTNNILKH